MPARSHGMSSTSVYKMWLNMIWRCRIGKYHAGRGIEVCERWQTFENFLEDIKVLGERPVGMTLDRINNDKNYEPGNIRWATPSEQNANRRNTIPAEVKAEIARLILFEGKGQTEVGKMFGINPSWAYRIAWEDR